MPLYDFLCSAGHGFEAFCSIAKSNKMRCGCGRKAKVDITQKAPADHTFKSQIFEHISSDPMLIESKKQLRDECKKHGCIATGYM